MNPEIKFNRYYAAGLHVEVDKFLLQRIATLVAAKNRGENMDGWAEYLEPYI